MTGRARWSLVAVVAAVAAVVCVLFGAGILGGTTAAPRASPSTPAPSTSAPPAPTQTGVPAMTRSVPTRLRIPAIDVDSDLMDLGLKADGTLETPPGAYPAGWFTGAPTPGQRGPAIIVGHVRFNTPGVFARLTELRRNDRVNVQRADGSTARFRVTRVQHFAKSGFPTRKVYGNIDHAGLRLITCGGLDADTEKFEENVVVFADLVPSSRS
ncbi:MAG: class F sortase [Propionibacteriaceae bacterium]